MFFLPDSEFSGWAYLQGHVNDWTHGGEPQEAWFGFSIEVGDVQPRAPSLSLFPSRVNLAYSADGGGNWSPVAAGLGFDRFGRGSYSWTVPGAALSSDQYLIRAGVVPLARSARRFRRTVHGGRGHARVLCQRLFGRRRRVHHGVREERKHRQGPMQPMASLSPCWRRTTWGRVTWSTSIRATTSCCGTR